ncbi:response regulator transcription factor [Paracrocinitomix mangrovi]|uniref:response regulator transcription factor n=1 Tax=Paracrocinitomix mangrovi TaxID=2862509 RepID=UPI001C8E24F3|nr:response regulator transcription factor [Paracrocinitomix mangrovi]UKN03243.1 response regulator transcription factor [Paracrocinitomix mangrovi]
MKKRILLAEDEENFGSLLKNYLELSQYDVTWAKNGTEAYSIFMQNDFDLCILDVMMPHMDGFTLGEKIAAKKDVPFFYLTAKNQKEDLVKGYQIGADDYLTKPFDTEVLLLKIKALINRTNTDNLMPETKESYQFGTYIFNPSSRMLQHVNGDKKLSPKEALLLELLCRYQGKIMPRDIALDTIWKQNDYFTKRSMDVYIGKLRKYLVHDSSIKIETFHQMGFQLMVEV